MNKQQNNTFLSLKNISYSKKNNNIEKEILKDIFLDIKQNSLMLITGENGSGKSTLIKIISSLIPPTKGEVINSQHCAVVFQDADSNILGDTPLSDILFSLSSSKLKKEEKLKIAEDTLSNFNLLHLKDNPAFFLSGGEKRRLSIASNTVLSPDVIIFDEPYSNLDYKSIKMLNKIIQYLKKEGKTIIIVSHEIEKCLSLADCVVVLKEGKIVYNSQINDSSFFDRLEEWGVHNPLSYTKDISSLVWI